VQDGTVTITAEFRLEKPTQEAVDDVRSPCSGCAPTCPPTCATRGQQDEPVGRAHPGLHHRSARGMDDEALSWFVDNDRHAKPCWVSSGVGSVATVWAA
jgi:multidrug efflux pump subunit AcrB